MWTSGRGRGLKSPKICGRPLIKLLNLSWLGTFLPPCYATTRSRITSRSATRSRLTSRQPPAPDLPRTQTPAQICWGTGFRPKNRVLQRSAYYRGAYYRGLTVSQCWQARPWTFIFYIIFIQTHQSHQKSFNWFNLSSKYSNSMENITEKKATLLEKL